MMIPAMTAAPILAVATTIVNVLGHFRTS
jgi:hypothetical protein